MTNFAMQEYYSSECACGLAQLNDFFANRVKDGRQWIFRGQGNKSWGLKSTLERQMDRFDLDKSSARKIERGLLRRFKRQCQHYIKDVPDDTDYLEWLALMQHHGTPTRLLDWTYSFWVALFFALEDADKENCAVWALNTDWMKKPCEAILSQDCELKWVWKSDQGIQRPYTFKRIFLRDPALPIVGAVTPERLNQRLVIQQGVFLCPGDVSKTFEDNLIAVLSKQKDESKANFIKLEVEVTLNTRRDILVNLQRMNMNSATLFPGLDGFARSLKTLMADYEKFLNPGIDESRSCIPGLKRWLSAKRSFCSWIRQACSSSRQWTS